MEAMAAEMAEQAEAGSLMDQVSMFFMSCMMIFLHPKAVCMYVCIHPTFSELLLTYKI
jgi:hypothetical protein